VRQVLAVVICRFFFFLCCFFFSSRRRHTRFKCDWSSDVCSSDLKVWPRGVALQPARCSIVTSRASGSAPPSSLSLATGNQLPDRSEERRVGKECRAGWSTDH